MSSKLIWKKGKPPHVGWWNASNQRDFNGWRWWNGTSWSGVVYPDDDLYEMCRCLAQKNSPFWGGIEWNHRWPENARVARINPVTGKVTGKGPKP